MTLPLAEKVVRHLFIEIAGLAVHEVVVRYIFKFRTILQPACLLSSRVIYQQRAFQKVFFELGFGDQQCRIIQGFVQNHRVFRIGLCPAHNAGSSRSNVFYVGSYVALFDLSLAEFEIFFRFFA